MFLVGLLLFFGAFLPALAMKVRFLQDTTLVSPSEIADTERPSTNNFHVLLAAPHGVCEGVVRAIDTVEAALKLWGPPLFVKHEIVHNRAVCDDLRAKGAQFVEDLNDVPENTRVVFSAHGSPPSDYETAKRRNLTVIDASCPLVTKVHSYVKKAAADGAHIILIGQKDHIEVIGVKGEAPDVVTVVETPADIEDLKFKSTDKLFLASQTTLSLEDVREMTKLLKEKYPSIDSIPSGSICFATTNRQMALEACLPDSDICFVVGDPQSSNAVKLVDLGVRRGVKTYLIRGPGDISESDLNNVRTACVTGGASSPPWLLDSVLKKIRSLGGRTIERRVFAEEGFKWKLPGLIEKAITERKKEGNWSFESVGTKIQSDI